MMKEVLKKIFDAHPGKSTMALNGRCSDCGRKVAVVVEATSEGYGLMGGVLEKASSENYAITCIDCYKSKPNIAERRAADAASTY